jgi:hypothetical protein
MNNLSKTIVFCLSALIFACTGNNCSQLPAKFSNADEAMKAIKSTHFKVQESVLITESSWVRSAYYYSCDGITGYFILVTDDQETLYSGVPAEVWHGFKNADSFGDYFNHNIKHKYKFKPIVPPKL